MVKRYDKIPMKFTGGKKYKDSVSWKEEWENSRLAPDNYMNICFDPIAENESFARVVAAAFMTQLDPVLEEVDDVKTAVSEAVTNCVIHGYPDAGMKGAKLSNSGRIHMECFLKNMKLYISIKDHGVGIENIEKAMEPLFTTKPDLERSGMGFAFMEAFMDELHVESRPDAGTTVYMCKQIGGQ